METSTSNNKPQDVIGLWLKRHPYQVVIGDEKTVALSDWLFEELAKYRAVGKQPDNE